MIRNTRISIVLGLGIACTLGGGGATDSASTASLNSDRWMDDSLAVIRTARALGPSFLQTRDVASYLPDSAGVVIGFESRCAGEANCERRLSLVRVSPDGQVKVIGRRLPQDGLGTSRPDA